MTGLTRAARVGGDYCTPTSDRAPAGGARSSGSVRRDRCKAVLLPRLDFGALERTCENLRVSVHRELKAWRHRGAAYRSFYVTRLKLRT